MFKAKPYKRVGTKDWEVLIPTPPKAATHARMVLHDEYDYKGRPKMATLPIEDFGCFKGVVGDFYYLKLSKDKQRKVLDEWSDKSWYWNGKEVAGLEVD